MSRPKAVAEAVDLFLAHLEYLNYSARTVRCYQSDLGRLVEFLEGIEGVEWIGEVGREQLARFRGWLASEYRSKRGKPITPGTQLHILAAMRSFFAHAWSQRWIGHDPATAIELPRIQKRLPRDVLTEEEVERLLDAPDVSRAIELRDKAVLELLYGSGMRRSELHALRVYDIDFDLHEVRIERGKGGRGRVVPVPSVVCHWVERYLAEVRPGLVGEGSGDTLFLSMRGRPFRAGLIVDRLRLYARRAAIAKDPKCHGLRHTYGTHLLRRGMDIRLIQRLLGHRSLSSTQVYTRIDPSDLKNAFHRAHPRSEGEEDA